MPTVEPGSDKSTSSPKTATADSISDAERELYGGRLRYDQSYARHEGPLTRLKFGHMAAALPHMVGMVLRTGWTADRRALMGVVTAELGQGVTAGWGLVAVNGVLAQLFASGPTVNKLRDALPSLVALAVVAVAGAVLAAWSTAMSGRLEPQVERAVSARYYARPHGLPLACPPLPHDREGERTPMPPAPTAIRHTVEAYLGRRLGHVDQCPARPDRRNRPAARRPRPLPDPRPAADAGTAPAALPKPPAARMPPPGAASPAPTDGMRHDRVLGGDAP
ncbi:hypothetical protein EV284_0790 [Streptomyces sp. BK022]|uniref:hypothetical protein n=1 Tax=Streptomyces sp. BK022 TaxID=2512123 RepID=UPI0010D35008|nr:hypothetical protein [Streptomyces sp. BK022]RZU46122.1 hypothetical protein EV284_0790 [Streptomyces sp. BK022]